MKFDEVILENLKENDRYQSDAFVEEDKKLINNESARNLNKDVRFLIKFPK